MKYIETLLDRYTMYQVIIATLSVWIVASIIFAALGALPYEPLAMLAALLVLLVSALVVHYICAWVTKAPANVGSTIITVLILYFVFDPILNTAELFGLAAVGGIAVLSKYLLAYRHLHIVNPVAIAAVLASVLGLAFATWWVATPIMLALVLVGGFLIVAKIRRFAMVGMGIGIALMVFGFQAVIGDFLSLDELWLYLVSTPILFFMSTMVTEPLTTPPGHTVQVMYGSLIGVLMNVPFTLGPFFSSPELVLVLANIAFYPFTLKARLSLELVDKITLANKTVEYQFRSSYPLSYRAGQYLEWTLPHKQSDSRGIRRYFTIASAPHESLVRLAVRFAEAGSSFKRALEVMEPGDRVYATSLGGDFLLPKHPTQSKIVFVAGGIGVTPFRSHIAALLKMGQPVDAVLYYCNKHYEDIAYDDYFKAAAATIGLEIVHVLAEPPADWSGESGYITTEMLTRLTPDVSERQVYISGPSGMVSAYKKVFAQAGVAGKNIHTDYFPGLA